MKGKLAQKEGVLLQTALCRAHSSHCPCFPRPPPTFRGHRCNVAGPLCFDFSNMGKRMGWLGQASFLTFWTWCLERRFEMEDWVLVENVPQWPHEALEEALGDLYDIQWISNSPVQLGCPAQRKRKYVFLLLRRSLRWNSFVEAHGGLQEVFGAVFYTPIAQSEVSPQQPSVTGDCLLRAPAADVKSFLQRQAERRGLQAMRHGKSWSCYQTLSAGARGRLEEYERQLGDAEKRPPMLANITQSAHRGQISYYVPALLRGSALWSFRKRRLAIPLEHCEVQGYSVWGESPLISERSA